MLASGDLARLCLAVSLADVVGARPPPVAPGAPVAPGDDMADGDDPWHWYRYDETREHGRIRQRVPGTQVESLWRLIGVHMLPRFDVLIMDESESLLRHFASPTVNAPIQAADAFVKMARMARRGVVCLDAMWGAATWTVLRQAGMSNVLVVNDSKPDAEATRTYRFSNDEATWSGQVVADLAAGLNVVVVSLSAERAMAVHAAGVAVVGAESCLIHTSKTGDELKKELADVGALWSRFRLVVYSPTIAAGVDFSLDHFDRMYVYLCAMSALPATALQMSFRVRKLRDMCVSLQMDGFLHRTFVVFTCLAALLISFLPAVWPISSAVTYLVGPH